VTTPTPGPWVDAVRGDVAVVVPCAGRSPFLGQALAAVDAWPLYLVDDSPSELAPSLIRGRERLRGPRRGYAQAVNLGLEAARRDGFQRVLLLNDDAVPEPGCIPALLAASREIPGVGAAGAALFRLDGSLESAGIDDRRQVGRVVARRVLPSGCTEVDAVSGACVLVESWLRLDGRFGFYFEDVDFCRRLRAAGRRVVVVPEARCKHAGGATLQPGTRLSTRRAVAGHLRLARHQPAARPLVLAWALAQILREGGPPERVLGILEGAGDAIGSRRP
jgi:GT2 family glycosyltransferase